MGTVGCYSFTEWRIEACEQSQLHRVDLGLSSLLGSGHACVLKKLCWGYGSFGQNYHRPSGHLTPVDMVCMLVEWRPPPKVPKGSDCRLRAENLKKSSYTMKCDQSAVV